MNNKPLSPDNIPDDINYGKGGLTVFECHNEKIYDYLRIEWAGMLFHKKDTDGRMYIKCGNSVIKKLKEYNFL